MRSIAIVLITSLLALGTHAFAQEVTDFRKVAEAIPLGSKVKIHTLDGKRLSGTLMRVDDSSVMVKKSTRMPEAAVSVTFDRMSTIERDHGGVSWGKAIGIGVAAGAGAILTMFVIALQLD